MKSFPFKCSLETVRASILAGPFMCRNSEEFAPRLYATEVIVTPELDILFVKRIFLKNEVALAHGLISDSSRLGRE